MPRSRARVLAIVAAAAVLFALVSLTVTASAAVAAGDDRSPEQVQERARQILGRDEFKDQTTLLQRVLDWLGDHIPTPSTSTGRAGSGLVGDIVLLGVAAVLVYALLRVLRSIRRAPPKERLEGPVLDVEERRTATALRREAEVLEAAGRWREAMLARYRELITTLVDRRVVADVPGRTSGEYRREYVEAHPARADAFTEATDLFERAWYGAEPTGPDENARFRSLSQEVSARAPELVQA